MLIDTSVTTQYSVSSHGFVAVVCRNSHITHLQVSSIPSFLCSSTDLHGPQVQCAVPRLCKGRRDIQAGVVSSCVSCIPVEVAGQLILEKVLEAQYMTRIMKLQTDACCCSSRRLWHYSQIQTYNPMSPRWCRGCPQKSTFPFDHELCNLSHFTSFRKFLLSNVCSYTSPDLFEMVIFFSFFVRIPIERLFGDTIRIPSDCVTNPVPGSQTGWKKVCFEFKLLSKESSQSAVDSENTFYHFFKS